MWLVQRSQSIYPHIRAVPVEPGVDDPVGVGPERRQRVISLITQRLGSFIDLRFGGSEPSPQARIDASGSLTRSTPPWMAVVAGLEAVWHVTDSDMVVAGMRRDLIRQALAVIGESRSDHLLHEELPLVFRPLHDALIEDALDRAATSLGLDPEKPRWSRWKWLLCWADSWRLSDGLVGWCSL